MIYSPKSNPSLIIERWGLRLLRFTFKVKYIPGNRNVADRLSRLIAEPTEQQDVNKDYAMQGAIQAIPKTPTGRMIEEVSLVDEEIRQVWQTVQTDDFNQVDELTTVGHIVIQGNRMLIPKKMSVQTPAGAHEGHQWIVRTKQR